MDSDPLQTITYRITSGNPEGFFAINSTTGEYSEFGWYILFLHFSIHLSLSLVGWVVGRFCRLRGRQMMHRHIHTHTNEALGAFKQPISTAASYAPRTPVGLSAECRIDVIHSAFVKQSGSNALSRHIKQQWTRAPESQLKQMDKEIKGERKRAARMRLNGARGKKMKMSEKEESIPSWEYHCHNESFS